MVSCLLIIFVILILYRLYYPFYLQFCFRVKRDNSKYVTIAFFCFIFLLIYWIYPYFFFMVLTWVRHWVYDSTTVYSFITNHTYFTLMKVSIKKFLLKNYHQTSLIRALKYYMLDLRTEVSIYRYKFKRNFTMSWWTTRFMQKFFTGEDSVYWRTVLNKKNRVYKPKVIWKDAESKAQFDKEVKEKRDKWLIDSYNLYLSKWETKERLLERKAWKAGFIYKEKNPPLFNDYKAYINGELEEPIHYHVENPPRPFGIKKGKPELFKDPNREKTIFTLSQIVSLRKFDKRRGDAEYKKWLKENKEYVEEELKKTYALLEEQKKNTPVVKKKKKSWFEEWF